MEHLGSLIYFFNPSLEQVDFSANKMQLFLTLCPDWQTLWFMKSLVQAEGGPQGLRF